jgi:phage portal protein BeeE
VGLLSNLFNRIVYRYYIQGSQSGITAFDKEAYENELCRAIIDTIATHAAKAQAMHVVVDKNDRIKEIKYDSPYSKLLNGMPNGLMTGYDLKYRLFSQQEQYTGAFCYVKWNGIQPEMILPIDYVNVEIMPVKGGGYAIQFMEKDGIQTILPLEDVIVLRKLFGKGEVIGDGNIPVQNTMNMIKAADEGNMAALSVSNKVRGLLKQKKSMMAPGDVQKGTDDFATRFKAAAANGGIIGVDSMEEYTQLNAQTLTMNAPQLIEIKKNLNRYWHVSEAIVVGDYTDIQFQAFFESVVEPRLIQASQAFTNGFFTKREKEVGNRLIFNTSIMMHASIQNKLNIVRESRETGLLTPNEQRELFGYAPVEGGDERLVSLNFVKESDQSKYQTGKEKPEEKPAEGNGDDGQNEPN